jgi:hypothetical protein
MVLKSLSSSLIIRIMTAIKLLLAWRWLKYVLWIKSFLLIFYIHCFGQPNPLAKDVQIDLLSMTILYEKIHYGIFNGTHISRRPEKDY